MRHFSRRKIRQLSDAVPSVPIHPSARYRHLEVYYGTLSRRLHYRQCVPLTGCSGDVLKIWQSFAKLGPTRKSSREHTFSVFAFTFSKTWQFRALAKMQLDRSHGSRDFIKNNFSPYWALFSRKKLKCAILGNLTGSGFPLVAWVLKQKKCF